MTKDHSTSAYFLALGFCFATTVAGMNPGMDAFDAARDCFRRRNDRRSNRRVADDFDATAGHHEPVDGANVPALDENDIELAQMPTGITFAYKVVITHLNEAGINSLLVDNAKPVRLDDSFLTQPLVRGLKVSARELETGARLGVAPEIFSTKEKCTAYIRPLTLSHKKIGYLFSHLLVVSLPSKDSLSMKKKQSSFAYGLAPTFYFATTVACMDRGMNCASESLESAPTPEVMTSHPCYFFFEPAYKLVITHLNKAGELEKIVKFLGSHSQQSHYTFQDAQAALKSYPMNPAIVKGATGLLVENARPGLFECLKKQLSSQKNMQIRRALWDVVAGHEMTTQPRAIGF
ncbi:hypothetical protein FA10DRAFT_260447 [Acaromyces ingoldii]|uniref:Uncharacterized protein n=1 Tax=Acaromyces ingoldii TaxID=215250 RepID=A0A316YNC9_9BASI|nr:hypothetical protein FA10DRAFT_260447 [Acaromyces ingoldii]PWN90652.1 hypothetical protein FA10DRAFT_260447 [Acaromyces ingoldii]